MVDGFSSEGFKCELRLEWWKKWSEGFCPGGHFRTVNGSRRRIAERRRAPERVRVLSVFSLFDFPQTHVSMAALYEIACVGCC